MTARGPALRRASEPGHDAEAWLARLWDRDTLQDLLRGFDGVAIDALTTSNGPVRARDAEATARRLIARSAGRADPVRLLRGIQRASVQVAHPRYMAQQVAAPLPLAALVEHAVSAMNQSLAVWEMSPIATAIDRDLMQRFRRLFGLPEGADGTLVSGGAIGNLTGLLAAREALSGSARQGHPAIIVGSQAHYSISRAANVLGFEPDSLYTLPVDESFRTDLTGLSAVIASARRRGHKRVILVGSAGSTPTGSFDDLTALRRIADRERAWLHVDAAHGAGLAFSRRYRRLLRGLGAADSVTFDPHKMMFMPLAAGGILLRDGRLLSRALKADAPYLFGAVRAWPDIGHRTLACSQRFDALKIWLTYRCYGPALWDALVSRTCQVCRVAYDYLEQSPVLEPLHAPQSNILCFRVRNARPRDADRLHWTIKEEMNESGYAYLSSTVLAGRRVLRLVIMNPRTGPEHVRQVLARVEAMARSPRTRGRRRKPACR